MGTSACTPPLLNNPSAVSTLADPRLHCGGLVYYATPGYFTSMHSPHLHQAQGQAAANSSTSSPSMSVSDSNLTGGFTLSPVTSLSTVTSVVSLVYEIPYVLWPFVPVPISDSPPSLVPPYHPTTVSPLSNARTWRGDIVPIRKGVGRLFIGKFWKSFYS